MSRKGSYGRKENDLGALIDRLVVMAEELSPEQRSQQEPEEMDEFTRLKKLAARQVSEIRKMIGERDDLLEASGGSGGRQAVVLSSKIRELLRNVHETHKAMQNELSAEERQMAKEESLRAKGKASLLSRDDLDAHVQLVELTGKHIAECEALEKKRYQTPGGGGRSAFGPGGGGREGGGGRGGPAGRPDPTRRTFGEAQRFVQDMRC
ncbi:hypothetical protein GUITHDRAFT_108485 [Guillardia theta CCMP2712]|uniref:Syntaxin N-terminal domain-containing protein n=1 Tax=Guillardia theta (strain CCMP2712) TaxID=905079 RepID=L1JBY5_GUITC|nr:hypothetical protein GUITHDRAFT_108485 [Guillardia theta CCMP2712]EKX45610.1 hypothetical protein GUITHDRAFT_108485 [Guillardia theta CCMP2712]|eukprot:XP_005832590.1 hypothetical protein GUITHDRAFT_108485 [Guillardia theta CCMP2712]